MSRIILHVDMDSFYASIEKNEDTNLKDQPVIVFMGRTEGRQAVAACSYETRKYGVKSGMPLSIAKKLCPKAVFKKANHDLYDEISKRIIDILKQYADKIEKVSIDEAYLDITNKAKDYREAKNISINIKNNIKQKENLTCSIGIAPNKTIAKIASANKKPDGITTVTPERVKKFLYPLPVKKIPGIGKKTAEELQKIGVKTIEDIANKPKVTFVERFGKNGVWMWDVANGIDETPVKESDEMKSISTIRTLEEDTANWETIYETIDIMINEVFQRIKKENYLFKTIGIMLTFDDFKNTTRAKTLHKHVFSNEVIQETIKQLSNEFEKDPRKIRRIGVKISNFKLNNKTEYSLDQYI